MAEHGCRINVSDEYQEVPDTHQVLMNYVLTNFGDQYVLDDPILSNHEVHMGKIGRTARTRQKAEEKEIRWKNIDVKDLALYEAAEIKQWNEHLKYEAVEVMTLEKSQEVRNTLEPERILTSRFAYRDKNAGLRTHGTEYENLPVKAKARLCVGGHRDPDISGGCLRTDAPTIGRTALLCFHSIGWGRDWLLTSADVEAAFLRGTPCDRNLYFEPPENEVSRVCPRGAWS